MMPEPAKQFSSLPSELGFLKSQIWEPVAVGESGSGIYHIGEYFLKITSAKTMGYADEATRLRWLQGRLPVPELHYAGVYEDFHFLLTSVVDGVNLVATSLTPQEKIMRYAQALRALHHLPIGDCPFVLSVDAQIERARQKVIRGKVRTDLFDPLYQGRAVQSMFDEMLSLRPTDLDPVVVHCDLYNDNFFVNAVTGELTGIIDVGAVGVADRCTDFVVALDDELVSDLGETGRDLFFQAYGISRPDPKKMAFYHLLNEFF